MQKNKTYLIKGQFISVVRTAGSRKGAKIAKYKLDVVFNLGVHGALRETFFEIV
ncbi:MAG: hypothetical protein ABI763_05305 [Bacteroidota bacterium]